MQSNERLDLVGRVPRQLRGISPFAGDIRPSRVRLFHPGSGRPSLPFPHPWNDADPIRILETYFWGADAEPGSGRHNRYLDVPGFSPLLVTRDPRVIRAVATATGDRAGQFDRDTLPSTGIARATGKDTLSYANGARWRRQKKLAAGPFGKTSLFQPEKFREFSETFRHTVQDAYAAFEQLTDIVLAPRAAKRGLWKQFKSDAPDELLRSNIKVFLAAALEATTSYASWAIDHLARNPQAQEKLLEDVREIEDYSPENLAKATYLGHVLNETLRLTPSLYFLPRRATADTWIETANGNQLMIPRGTHLLLDVWHANRHEDHWGIGVTGSPAGEFVPERWETLAAQGRQSKEILHFGFGHGPRVCPGKHLGQLEVGLAVGAFVKLFRFRSVHAEGRSKAGVSTKPADGVLVTLERRQEIVPGSQPGQPEPVSR